MNEKEQIEELKKRIEELEQKKDCPPHNLMPYIFTGVWSASTPPPTMICSKCLMTI